MQSIKVIIFRNSYYLLPLLTAPGEDSVKSVSKKVGIAADREEVHKKLKLTLT